MNDFKHLIKFDHETDQFCIFIVNTKWQFESGWSDENILDFGGSPTNSLNSGCIEFYMVGKIGRYEECPLYLKNTHIPLSDYDHPDECFIELSKAIKYIKEIV